MFNAENEIKLACEQCDEPYFVECCKSALKAYKSLENDNHSGMSWALTGDILKKLMNFKPLVPIMGTDDEWEEIVYSYRIDGNKEWQNKRCPSLFKTLHEDGSIIYRDVDRFVCYLLENPETKFRSGVVNRFLNSEYPIEFPYIPEKYYVGVEELLLDPNNGDFDVVAIRHFSDSCGNEVIINKFYQEHSGRWHEIDYDQYEKIRYTIAERNGLIDEWLCRS